MICSALLYYTILYYTVIKYTLLYYDLTYYNILYSAILYPTLLYSTSTLKGDVRMQPLPKRQKGSEHATSTFKRDVGMSLPSGMQPPPSYDRHIYYVIL